MSRSHSKQDRVFFSGAVSDEKIRFESAGGFPGHEHRKPLGDLGIFYRMIWTDDNFFPRLRHFQFDLEHIAGVGLELWLVDLFTGGQSQHDNKSKENLNE